MEGSEPVLLQCPGLLPHAPRARQFAACGGWACTVRDGILEWGTWELAEELVYSMQCLQLPSLRGAFLSAAELLVPPGSGCVLLWRYSPALCLHGPMQPANLLAPLPVATAAPMWSGSPSR